MELLLSRSLNGLFK